MLDFIPASAIVVPIPSPVVSISFNDERGDSKGFSVIYVNEEIFLGKDIINSFLGSRCVLL